jgi:hypothetical protein
MTSYVPYGRQLQILKKVKNNKKNLISLGKENFLCYQKIIIDFSGYFLKINKEVIYDLQ